MNDFITRKYTDAQIAIREDETGATAVEYGLLVAAIAAVIVAVVFLLGGEVKGAFDTVNNEMKAH